MFNETDDQTDTPIIQKFNQLFQSYGVISRHRAQSYDSIKFGIACSSGCLNIHPLDGKPTKIVGAYDIQVLFHEPNFIFRQILMLLNATVMPGSEFYFWSSASEHLMIMEI